MYFKHVRWRSQNRHLSASFHRFGDVPRPFGQNRSRHCGYCPSEARSPADTAQARRPCHSSRSFGMTWLGGSVARTPRASWAALNAEYVIEVAKRCTQSQIGVSEPRSLGYSSRIRRSETGFGVGIRRSLPIKLIAWEDRPMESSFWSGVAWATQRMSVTAVGTVCWLLTSGLLVRRKRWRPLWTQCGWDRRLRSGHLLLA